jgi:ketosteroid isomerase-like protein
MSKRIAAGFVILSLALTVTSTGSGAAQKTNGCSQQAWQEFVQRLAQAQAAYVRADPEPIKLLWSHADDVSLFGAYGGHERGWSEVDPRLTWASKTNSNGTHDNDEVLTTIRGTDLALVTQLEHITNRKPDGSAAPVQNLRVTHVARCEASSWRLVHRQADPLVETKPPVR